jgi:hypothetical protein
MSIFEHYFASKPIDAVREKFMNAYPDKEVANKTTEHGNEVRDTRGSYDRQHFWCRTDLRGETIRHIEKTLALLPRNISERL